MLKETVGATLYEGDETPAGDDGLWIDTTDPDSPVLKRHNGEEWQAVGAPGSGGSSTPSHLILRADNLTQTAAWNEDTAANLSAVEYDTLAEVVGTAISWDIGSPTVVNLLEAGYYAAYATIFWHLENVGDKATAAFFISMFSPQAGANWGSVNPGGFAVPAGRDAASSYTYGTYTAYPFFEVKAENLPAVFNLGVLVNQVTGDVIIDGIELAVMRFADSAAA